MSRKKRKPKTPSRLPVTSGTAGTKNIEDPWDAHLKKCLEKVRAPWTVSPLHRQFVVRDKAGTVIAACDSEQIADAIAGMPYALCAISGANRVVETTTEFEVEILKKASQALYNLLLELICTESQT